MPLNILVTGATGTVGTQTVRALARREGVRVVAAVRDSSKAESLPTGVRAVHMDWGDPASVTAAVQGMDKVFVLTPFAPGAEVLTAELAQAAAEAGVKHIVKLSTSGAEFEPGILLGRWHREAEEAIEASGVAWTHLRPGSFMSNFITYFRPDEHGNIYLPLGSAPSSWIDPRDIAEVAAEVLTTDGHAGQAYTLTGPEALTASECAAAIALATGKVVTYVDVPAEAAQAAMEGMGAPDWMVQGMMELYGLMKAGWTSGVSPAVEQVTGRPAGTFADFAQDYAHAW